MQKSRKIREGYLGLFSLLGLISFGFFVYWLIGGIYGSKTYMVNVKFNNASGIKEGAPVNYRGVLIGSVEQIIPHTDRVEALLRLSDKAKIPIGSRIEVSHSGLLGESSIEISPIDIESKNLEHINPMDTSCNPQVIYCKGSQIDGTSGGQVFANLSRLTDALTNPLFLARVNTTVKNVADLTSNLAKTSKNLNMKLDKISDETLKAARSINQTAKDTSKVSLNLNSLLLENHKNINQTVVGTKDLIVTLNEMIKENRANIAQSITNVQKTSRDIDQTALELGNTVRQARTLLNAPESARILSNLDKVMAASVETSKNLQNISRTFNDPKTILTIQETLQSARSTFENTQKISADLDDLTGDPKFRTNLRRLVNGLSSLVSTADDLDKQIRLSQSLQFSRLSLEPSKIPSNVNDQK